MDAILAWGKEHNIDCLYFLAESDDPQTIRLAEDNGFRFQDVRMTFECKRTGMANSSPTTDIALRFSSPEDVDSLRAIASTAYVHTRFYNDPCFSVERCAAMYDMWIRKSCLEGYADAVIVAEFEGRAVGYVTCHLHADVQEGKIGLVGVAEDARGHQIGQRLVNYSLDWFWQQNMKTVSVVTQGRNVAAQRLYQRCGFLTRSVRLWYHKWLTNCTAKV